MGTATSMMMGVADMPIQTLKLLNIHPDARAARKGKGKATGDGSTLSEESVRKGRSAAVPKLDTTDSSTASDSNADPAGVQDLPTTSATILNSVDTTTSSPDIPGTPNHRSTFMAQAFAESAQGSRSSSRDRARHLLPQACEVAERIGHGRRASSSPGLEARSTSGTTSPKLAGSGMAETMETAVDTGKGLARIISAGFKSPMDFSLNVAQGFHNVPKLYGAEVRQVDKVTDFQSGMRTAAKVG